MRNIHNLLLLASFVILHQIPHNARGQQTDYNKIVVPMEVDSVEFSERLVQLAWENQPAAHKAKTGQDIAALEVKKAKLAWLNNLQAVGNLNEGNINPSESNPNLFFPRYNFGVQLNIGRLAETPINTKIAKENSKLAQEEVRGEQLRIRAEVLRLYSNYQMREELLNIQNEIIEDAYAEFLVAEEKFKTGEIPIDQYNLTLKTYNGERIKKIQAQHDLAKAKLDLEEAIGLRLEDVRWP
jgi:outer membrane protein TolC